MARLKVSVEALSFAIDWILESEDTRPESLRLRDEAVAFLEAEISKLEGGARKTLENRLLRTVAKDMGTTVIKLRQHPNFEAITAMLRERIAKGP